MHALIPRQLVLGSGKRYFACCRCRRQNARPSTAPKQIPDIRSIRDEPEKWAANAVLRNYTKHKDAPRRIAALATSISDINASIARPRKELKQLEKNLAAAKGAKDEATAGRVYKDIQALRLRVDEAIKQQDEATAEAHELAIALPNLTSSHTPTNNEPKLLGYINYDPANPPQPVEGADHSAIGQELALLDFASASTTTGWGFYYLLNDAALLEQALIQYAISVARKHGWQLATPPSLVYAHIADSCGFQPRDINDEQQIWQLAQPDRDADKPKRSLAATAEIPLAALYADNAIDEARLPLKLVGSSRCYRAEAGARGVDTKGLYRVHEFSKVEMFAWTDCPAQSRDAKLTEEQWTAHSTNVFDEMVQIQTEILTSLGLPCRVLEMPASDLGASAFRKIDIEAFFPSRRSRDQGWGELTSVSICTDYQSRRLSTRILEKGGARSKFPHTVNGTALAVPRVLACLLENHWDSASRTVEIPKVLRPYMDGKERISKS